jgi:predicted permease
VALLSELLRRLNADGAVERAAAIDRLPLAGDRNWNTINVVGRPWLDAAHAPIVEQRAVSASYLTTMGVRLVTGRAFTDDDARPGHRVAIVNEAMARMFWSVRTAVGGRLVSAYSPGDTIEVVGVAGDVRDLSLGERSAPELYEPYGWWTVMNIVLRGPSDADAAASVVRHDVRTLDPGVAVYGAARLEDVVEHSIARPRFVLGVFALFALLSLVLAAVGLFGLLAFSVSRRRQEIGVRIALGARAAGVTTLVLRQGMRLVIGGIALGTLASLATGRAIGSLLFELSPADPATFAVVAAMLVLVGMLASWIPARRAARVDPVIALSGE